MLKKKSTTVKFWYLYKSFEKISSPSLCIDLIDAGIHVRLMQLKHLSWIYNLLINLDYHVTSARKCTMHRYCLLKDLILLIRVLEQSHRYSSVSIGGVISDFPLFHPEKNSLDFETTWVEVRAARSSPVRRNVSLPPHLYCLLSLWRSLLAFSCHEEGLGGLDFDTRQQETCWASPSKYGRELCKSCSCLGGRSIS